MRKIHWLAVAIMILFSGCGISEKLQNVGITETREFDDWQRNGFTKENLNLTEEAVEDIIVGYKKADIKPFLAKKYYQYEEFRPQAPRFKELVNLHNIIYRGEIYSNIDVLKIVLWYKNKDNYLKIMNPNYGKYSDSAIIFKMFGNQNTIDKVLKKLIPYFDTKLFTKEYLSDNLEDIVFLIDKNISPKELTDIVNILGKEKFGYFYRYKKEQLFQAYLELKAINFTDEDFKKYFYFSDNRHEKVSDNVKILKQYDISYEEFKQYQSKWQHNLSFEDEIKSIAIIKTFLNPTGIHEWEEKLGTEIYKNPESLKLWIELGYDSQKAKNNFYGYEIENIKKVDQLLKLNIDKKLIKKGMDKNFTIEQIQELQKKKIELLKKQEQLIKANCNGKTPESYNALSAPFINPYETVGQCYKLELAMLVQVIDKYSGLYNLTFLKKSDSYVVFQSNKFAPPMIEAFIVKSVNVKTLSDNSKVPVMEYIAVASHED